MKHQYLFLFCILFLSIQINAQDSITNQDVKVNKQLWLDYNFKNSIDSSKILSTEIGFRKISPKVYNKYQIISTLSIPHNKGIGFIKLDKPIIESFELGAGVIFTDNYDADDNLEIRFIQGFKFNFFTLKRINFSNYIRLEERFQNAFNDSGWTTGFRLRYRISTVLAWKNHLIKFTDGIYIPLSVEMFFNLKKSESYNDLVRVSPGIGYRLKNDWKFELFLIFNESKNTTETTNNSSDFILRLRVFSGKINTNKK